MVLDGQQAIRSVVTARNFTMAVNYHAYGEMLAHPFSYAKEGGALLPRDDLAIYAELYDGATIWFIIERK